MESAAKHKQEPSPSDTVGIIQESPNFTSLLADFKGQVATPAPKPGNEGDSVSADCDDFASIRDQYDFGDPNNLLEFICIPTSKAHKALEEKAREREKENLTQAIMATLHRNCLTWASIGPGHIINWTRKHCVLKCMFVGGPLMGEQIDQLFAHTRNPATRKLDVWVGKDIKFDASKLHERYEKRVPSPDRRNYEYNFDHDDGPDVISADAPSDGMELLDWELNRQQQKKAHRQKWQDDLGWQLAAMEHDNCKEAVAQAEVQLLHHIRQSRNWTTVEWKHMLTIMDEKVTKGAKPNSKATDHSKDEAKALSEGTLLRVHYLMEELTHSLCLFRLKPGHAWTRTIWIRMLVEHPTSVNALLDVHEHGFDTFDTFKDNIKEHRLFEKNGKKLHGRGHFFWYPWEHGMSSMSAAREALSRRIKNEKEFRYFIAAAREIDYQKRYWGTKSVVFLYRKTTLEAWGAHEAKCAKKKAKAMAMAETRPTSQKNVEQKKVDRLATAMSYLMRPNRIEDRSTYRGVLKHRALEAKAARLVACTLTGRKYEKPEPRWWRPTGKISSLWPVDEFERAETEQAALGDTNDLLVGEGNAHVGICHGSGSPRNGTNGQQ